MDSNKKKTEQGEKSSSSQASVDPSLLELIEVMQSSSTDPNTDYLVNLYRRQDAFDKEIKEKCKQIELLAGTIDDLEEIKVDQAPQVEEVRKIETDLVKKLNDDEEGDLFIEKCLELSQYFDEQKAKAMKQGAAVKVEEVQVVDDKFKAQMDRDQAESFGVDQLKDFDIDDEDNQAAEVCKIEAERKMTSGEDKWLQGKCLETGEYLDEPKTSQAKQDVQLVDDQLMMKVDRDQAELSSVDQFKELKIDAGDCQAAEVGKIETEWLQVKCLETGEHIGKQKISQIQLRTDTQAVQATQVIELSAVDKLRDMKIDDDEGLMIMVKREVQATEVETVDDELVIKIDQAQEEKSTEEAAPDKELILQWYNPEMVRWLTDETSCTEDAEVISMVERGFHPTCYSVVEKGSNEADKKCDDINETIANSEAADISGIFWATDNDGEEEGQSENEEKEPIREVAMRPLSPKEVPKKKVARSKTGKGVWRWVMNGLKKWACWGCGRAEDIKVEELQRVAMVDPKMAMLV